MVVEGGLKLAGITVQLTANGVANGVRGHAPRYKHRTSPLVPDVHFCKRVLQPELTLVLQCFPAVTPYNTGVYIVGCGPAAEGK
ncbi:hypothetical protein AGIG_G21551 [Arapaima gigas]